MGQTRTDTSIQIEAKRRTARSRKCHDCGRLAAMSTRYELRDWQGERVGTARTCNYCGAERGVAYGEAFKTDAKGKRL